MGQRRTQKRSDRAEVVGFPPLVGGVSILFCLILQFFFPLNLPGSGYLQSIIGLVVLACGIGLQLSCLRILKANKTTPLFKKPTKKMVREGWYARSRNPIYVAVLIQVLGLGLIFNTFWLIILIPLLFLYLNFLVIVPEEKYLEHKFGDEYKKYKANVSRWI